MMSSIVIDYRKCVSIIDSCKNDVQLLNCDNIIKSFETKHRKNSTSWKRYKELSSHIRLRLSEFWAKN